MLEYFECNSCGDDKPRSAMVQNKNRPGGVDPECLRCKRERDNTPHARRQRKDRQLQHKYGITLKDYEQRVIKQNGRCACCGKPETRVNAYGEPKALAVDHDHQSNRIRGLLCASCNKGIGSLGDDPQSVFKAFSYLYGGAT